MTWAVLKHKNRCGFGIVHTIGLVWSDALEHYVRCRVRSDIWLGHRVVELTWYSQKGVKHELD